MARVRPNGFGATVNPYKFKPGPVARDPLMDMIYEYTRDVPEQIRDEVRQDIAVAVLSGAATEDQVPALVSEYKRTVLRKLYPFFERLSLDAPVKQGSSTTFKALM